MVSSTHVNRRRNEDGDMRTHSLPKRSRDSSKGLRRSRSPGGRHHHDSPRHKRKRSPSPRLARLPFSARPLSKRDLSDYKPMFALYLDIQKHLVLDDLSEDEMKGRWKSFVSKWNRGDLAEGWYDPATKQKAEASASAGEAQPPAGQRRRSPDYDARGTEEARAQSADDDEYGPTLPMQISSVKRAGPAIPNLQDIEFRNEQVAEENLAHREEAHYNRKQERKVQKERLEELVPRSETGSKERLLEKKREKAEQMRSFRDKSPGAEEVGERDMLGDDGLEGYKAKKMESERKKNEREVRKEELLRARAAEREERLAEHRAKEDKTMAMLRALAKERFG